MASTKESNTSKTAHVMNLLSRNRGGAAPAPDPDNSATAETPAPPAPAPEKKAPVPPILSSMEADAAVSTQIKDALEDALEDALAAEGEPAEDTPVILDTPEPDNEPPAPEEPEPPAPQEEATAMEWPEWNEDGDEVPPAQEEKPAPPPPPAQEEEPAPPPPPAQEEEPTPPPPPVQEEEPAPPPPPVQEEEPAPPPPPVQEEEPAEEAAEEEAEPDISYVNVMEALVEERAGKYMEMFGMCQCPRCRVDVKALALNNLPSKYVVMAKGEFIPRITVYEGRFSAAITAQLLRACKLVAESPRHQS